MRVIGGTHRSRTLFEVDSDKTRETRDRVKESIFNSIHTSLFDASVLDLFAGSGSLGIEAISRGAKKTHFVDTAAIAVRTIKKNIELLRITPQASIIKSEYLSYLEETDDVFDVILLDPPYELHCMESCVKLIAERKLLSKTGIIVALYSKNYELKLDSFDIIEYKHKKIGITNVSYLKWGI